MPSEDQSMQAVEEQRVSQCRIHNLNWVANSSAYLARPNYLVTCRSGPQCGADPSSPALLFP
jgi:hypothetical protein